jgi:hypothetical protein
MSNKTKNTKKNEEDPITIESYFKEYLDNKEVKLFRFVVHGYIKCKTPKRPMTAEIIIPEDICHGNIKEIDDWIFTIIEIPRK